MKLPFGTGAYLSPYFLGERLDYRYRLLVWWALLILLQPIGYPVIGQAVDRDQS